MAQNDAENKDNSNNSARAAQEAGVSEPTNQGQEKKAAKEEAGNENNGNSQASEKANNNAANKEQAVVVEDENPDQSQQEQNQNAAEEKDEKAPAARNDAGENIQVAAVAQHEDSANQVDGTDGADVLVGTDENDAIRSGRDQDEIAGKAGEDFLDGGAGDDKIEGGEGHDKLLGGEGRDTIDGGEDNDLAAGDYVGAEWQLVNGKWVYNPELQGYNPKMETTEPGETMYDDVITTGDGDDVLLGNRGHDTLKAGAGDDLLNAGTGADSVYGGTGDDVLNLEDGSDTAYGGDGADIVNAGAGDDLVYGDNGDSNLLDSGAAVEKSGATTFSQHAENGSWTKSENPDVEEMSRMVDTVEGETYNLSFDLAANAAGGASMGTVEVLWNGEVVDTITSNSGVYETHTVEVSGTGGESALTFRVVESEGIYTGPEIDRSGPIDSYEKTVNIGGEDVEIDAFAPGQAKLYQVIDGQLNVFDPVSEQYEQLPNDPGFKINAVGFNVEDDLIYGIAKSKGTDALGNEIDVPDVVMMDAKGNAYRIGDAPQGDYVGDFDASGNLWTFNTSLNRVTKIDVNNIGPDGNPVAQNFDIDSSIFGGRMYDIAFNEAENAFFAVESPSRNGGPGAVHKIDLSAVDAGGQPEISSIPIHGTMIDGEMSHGMAKGAYGAVFMDGDANLYFGLNRGDHDLDSGTDIQGGIYQVHMDFDKGTAHAEYKAEAQATGSNDGAIDPRAVDPFAPVDPDSTILIKDPTLTSNSGGNDDLRGGEGNDNIFGEAGDDKLFGGEGDDALDGGVGNDFLSGGTGDDFLVGGRGDDDLLGGEGDDKLNGGDGKDYINAGSGDDTIAGGAGDDKIVGGSGEDIIVGGAGNDHMWGGNWTGDQTSDTFIVSQGGGKDMIHDFEAAHDQLDLSAYGLEYSDLEGLMQDQGWATIIDLSGLDGAQAGDKLILKSVKADDLDEDNFLL